MKAILFLIISVSFYAFSQDEFVDDEVIMISPKTAYSCDHRLKEDVKPAYPPTLSMQHEISRYGACEIKIYFLLDKAGKIYEAKPLSSEERCNEFVELAIRSIREANFEVGESIDECHFTFAFEFNENT